jgi:hypothetical protein
MKNIAYDHDHYVPVFAHAIKFPFLAMLPAAGLTRILCCHLTGYS